jgi:serine/threonine protein kinase
MLTTTAGSTSYRSPVTPALPQLPFRISDSIGCTYECHRRLGAGAYGTVFQARQLHASGAGSCDVAVKILDTSTMTVEQRERLRFEIEVLRRLQPNRGVLQLLDVFEVDSPRATTCIVTELCSGGDLLQHVLSRGRLPESEARYLFKQLCEAVLAAHAAGICHRDIKLENIFLRADGSAVLGDWGFAGDCARDASSRLQAPLGSLHYSAPEIVAGRSYVGPEVDAWSLGVVLYALVTGCFPFRSADTSAVASFIITGNYHPPTRVSPACVDLVASLLALDASRRLRTLESIAQRRHPFLDGRNTSIGDMATPVAAAIDGRHSPSPRSMLLRIIIEEEDESSGSGDRSTTQIGDAAAATVEASATSSRPRCRSRWHNAAPATLATLA